MNVLEGDVADGAFRHAAGDIAIGDGVHAGPVALGFRPEHAELVAPGDPGALTGEIYVVEPLGNETLLTVRVDGALVNLRMAAGFAAVAGEPCGVRPHAGALHLFDVGSGDALATAGARSEAVPSVGAAGIQARGTI
jgi:multiple sugar transport system ATP-binding protein